VDALDGNAMAGDLHALFGAELTTVNATCAGCGAKAPIAVLAVYTTAIGTVARCSSCEAVVMVLVTVRGATHVDLRNLAALDLPT
jgi:hypothetical protein